MMLDQDRTAKVQIGGVEYPLIFTTKATKEIAKRYGGLANLGETLLKNENFEMALDEVTWLIALLANQSILIHNLQNEEKKPLLTEEVVELLTTPLQLADYKNAITEAMMSGTKRHVESEENTSEGEPIVVRQIKSTTIRHFILTGIAEKRSNKAYYKHLIRQIK